MTPNDPVRGWNETADGVSLDVGEEVTHEKGEITPLNIG